MENKEKTGFCEWHGLSEVLMLRRDSMTKETLLKEGIWLRFAYSFRGLVHCHHSGEHDSMLLGMVPES